MFFLLPSFLPLSVSCRSRDRLYFVIPVSFSQQIGAVSVEKMSSIKYEIEKFTGVNDFGLWRLKMKVLLVQQGCLEALKGVAAMDVALKDREKLTTVEKAHNANLLSLGDNVLQRVLKETTTSGLWEKLEIVYMTKSLVNRLYLK